MRIAIPVAEGKLAMHFGHCKQFALVDVDPLEQRIITKELVDAPEHQPGLLPRWLMERGASIVIAGGMGARALTLFAEQHIHVVVGAPAETVENLVQSYMKGTLESGENICDH
ncbi:MAG TPA: NifB/NifX family molybdenum-iron cluster-binding protein [Candidatus Hydrogenedentes bacterium]|nr:NifB/NifX family molybdenum-iron cluster-binding protein [Candidatus Hydrogenedentota bacterium]